MGTKTVLKIESFVFLDNLNDEMTNYTFTLYLNFFVFKKHEKSKEMAVFTVFTYRVAT